MNPSAAVSEHNYETNHPSSTVKLRIELCFFQLEGKKKKNKKKNKRKGKKSEGKKREREREETRKKRHRLLSFDL